MARKTVKTRKPVKPTRISIRLELTHEQMADLEDLCPPGVSKRQVAVAMLRKAIASGVARGGPTGIYLHLDPFAREAYEAARKALKDPPSGRLHLAQSRRPTGGAAEVPQE